MNSRRRKMKQIREENNNNGKKADKMHVKEWLHQNAKRPIKVKFGPDENFYLLNRKGDKLRTINIKNIESLVLEVTQVRHLKGKLLLRYCIDYFSVIFEQNRNDGEKINAMILLIFELEVTHSSIKNFYNKLKKITLDEITVKLSPRVFSPEITTQPVFFFPV